MLRRQTIFILVIVLLFSLEAYSQTYSGPSVGSIDTGAVVNTNSFADFPLTQDLDPIINGERNVQGFSIEPDIIETNGSEVFPVTYVEDNSISDNPNLVGENVMLLQKYNVTLDNNVIPPDPTIAVGPNHVMVLTNNAAGIRIYDKQGNLLKTISSNQWWSAVWPSQSGDPQILYDHFENRWVMVFMQVDDAALTAGNLIAYSDDEDPLGTWYMYRLDTKTHGTTSSNTWGDYPQIGFDEQAIYIMTRCFTFGGGFNYTKIRIISKNELYTSNAGTLRYTDIWNISLPGSSTKPDVIHPSFQYSNSGEHYLLYANRGGANYYVVYKITNPLTTPVLTGTTITVPFYGSTPNANQLGGGTPLIEANGSHMKTAPVFRNGYIYATHSIRNTTYPNYASIKYIKIDVSTNSIVESAELGANGYFYIYPAIAVDKEGNVAITCSRSADSEYIGSYFTTRRASDPAGLGNSQALQPGLGNYIITFGGDRNRWGDYLGAYLDPSDEHSFWMLSQFASGTNAYACVVGQVRLQPFDSIYTYSNKSSISFGDVEVGFQSDTLDLLLSNYGVDDFVISNIPTSVGDFQLASALNFPLTLSTFDSLNLKFIYTPTSEGAIDTHYNFDTNNPSFTGIDMQGFGFVIHPALENNIYAISGTQNSGNLVNINKNTGAGANIGFTFYEDFVGVTIDPKSHITYAFRTPTPSSAEIYRVNSEQGNSYKLLSLALDNLFSIAIDSQGVFWAIERDGSLFTINLDSSSYELVSTVPVERITMAFDPLDNQLWGSVKSSTNPKDLIIKINPLTGDTTNVGRTGFNANTTGITFDEYGVMYGVKGIGVVSNSDFFTIDKITGIGTIVGSVGLKDIRGIAYSLGEPNANEITSGILPTIFELSQNFPNPFNPSTQIRFALPVSANVKITIYNLLGEVVKQLTSKDMNAGNYTVQWNADDVSGNKVSSGIYFYELSANGIDGSRFNQVRKMMLLK